MVGLLRVGRHGLLETCGQKNAGSILWEGNEAAEKQRKRRDYILYCSERGSGQDTRRSVRRGVITMEAKLGVEQPTTRASNESNV